MPNRSALHSSDDRIQALRQQWQRGAAVKHTGPTQAFIRLGLWPWHGLYEQGAQAAAAHAPAVSLCCFSPLSMQFPCLVKFALLFLVTLCFRKIKYYALTGHGCRCTRCCVKFAVQQWMVDPWVCAAVLCADEPQCRPSVSLKLPQHSLCMLSEDA